MLHILDRNVNPVSYQELLAEAVKTTPDPERCAKTLLSAIVRVGLAAEAFRPVVRQAAPPLKLCR